MSSVLTPDTSSSHSRSDAAWLDAHWMPFTANRQFKADPRLIVEGKGAYFTDADGRKIFDGLSGLWCTGLGHCRSEIAEAVGRQAAKLDYSPGFQFGHPLSFELANRIKGLMPAGAGLDYVFFTDSGSESADTSLKMARAYWRAKGQGTKTRLIGREKGYHGVNFGGISVGGIVGNRKTFGQGVEADHIPHTQPAMGSFHQGMPAEGGVALANRLLDVIALHDASNIAAVIVEPFSGSAGVVIPPVGYLQRLREICTQNNILLIFDEVITGFGRLGAPFAAQAYGVRPDLMSCAKGMTNGAVPMGGVLVAGHVYDAFMGGPPEAIELLHGYTYSAHPLACAAGLATLDVFAEQDILGGLGKVLPLWEERAHRLKVAAHVADIRTAGLLCAIDLAPRPGADGARGGEAGKLCLDAGVLIRNAGDTLVLSPPLVIAPAEIEEIFTAIEQALGRIA